MKKVITNSGKDIVIYFMIFSFFFAVFWQVPLIQDEWAGQVYNSSYDFVQWILKNFTLYFTLNGRVIAQIVVGFFERNELMLDLGNAILMTLLVYSIVKLFEREKQIFFTITIWGLLLMVSTNMRLEVYFYATMIYLVPVVLLVAFVLTYHSFIKHNKEISRKQFGILCLLGVLNSGWIEHSGFAFVFSLGIYWIFRVIKDKKINLRFTIFEFLNGITFLIMILSPGLRLQRTIKPSGSLLALVNNNLSLTVQGVIYENKLIFCILVCACIIFINQHKNKKNKKVLCIYQAVMILYAGVFVLNILHEAIGIKIPIFLIQQATTWWKYGKIWCVCGIVLILLVLIPILFNSKKNEMVFAYFVGMFSLAPTIVTPNFGYRICFFALMLIIFLTAGIIADIKYKDNILFSMRILVSVVLVFFIDFYSILIANINEIQNKREQIIELVQNEQIMGTWDFRKTLILPVFPENLLFASASPHAYYDPEHHWFFKNFYKLSTNTLISFSNYNNELQVSLMDDGMINFKMIPENTDIPYEYEYYILQDRQIVWDSGRMASNELQIPLPLLFTKGSYAFMCHMIDAQGNAIEVFSAKVIDIP